MGISDKLKGMAAGHEDQAREGVEETAYTATQIVYAEDPILAERLRGTGSSLDYVRIGASDQRRRFETPQVHHYREVEVRHAVEQ